MTINVILYAVAAAAIILIAVYLIKDACKKPNLNQLLIIKEWLKWIVVQAEQQFDSGTGQLKLRYVYDLAIDTFPYITYSVTFEQFSEWVDDALIWMKKQLESNKAIEEYVNS